MQFRLYCPIWNTVWKSTLVSWNMFTFPIIFSFFKEHSGYRTSPYENVKSVDCNPVRCMQVNEERPTLVTELHWPAVSGWLPVLLVRMVQTARCAFIVDFVSEPGKSFLAMNSCCFKVVLYVNVMVLVSNLFGFCWVWKLFDEETGACLASYAKYKAVFQCAHLSAVKNRNHVCHITKSRDLRVFFFARQLCHMLINMYWCIDIQQAQLGQ